MFIFATVQAILHIYYDYDDVTLSSKRPEKADPTPEVPPKLVASLKALLGKELEPLKPLFWYDGNRIFTSAAKNVVLRTLVLSLLAPFVYAIFLRRIAWRWSLSFAALVWDVPPSQLSYIPPYYPSLIYRSLKSGLLLVVLFEASNALFSAYVAREPLKKGQPLTAESKDPNGSLLTGLKSRKEIPKVGCHDSERIKTDGLQTFALWELSHIAAHHSERRKNLFTDIDRPSGSVSTQIFTVGIAYIISIHSRISTFQSPTAPTQPALMQRPPAIESLPHISTPLRKENIFTRTPPPATSVERIESNVGSIAKSYGQSPNPGTFKFSSAASSPARSLSNLLPSTPPRKLLTQGPSSQQTPSSAGGLLGKFKIYMDTFLRSTVGTLFRHTFARRAQSIILGSPTSTLHPLISAVRSLSALAVASLTEDPYGKVAKDIPILIRTYISTIQQIKIFLSIGLPVHWTDVDFHEGESRRVPEIDFLLRELKEALKAVLTGFGPFANELGIPARDVAVARKLVEGIGEAGDEETSAGSGRDPNVRPGLGEKGSEKAAGMNGKGGGKTIDPRPEMEQVR